MIRPALSKDSLPSPRANRTEKHFWLFSKMGKRDAPSTTERQQEEKPGALHPHAEHAPSPWKWDWKKAIFSEETPTALAEEDWDPETDAEPEPKPAMPSKGEILILSDDLKLVLSLRQDLLSQHYDLNWTNNFWIAISYLHNRRFSSLIFDTRVLPDEEHFALDFLEEYDRNSKGKRVFMAASTASPALRRLLREQSDAVLEQIPSSQDLIACLELSP